LAGRLAAAILFLVAATLPASEIQVPSTRVRVDEPFRIAVALEGEEASVDDVELPLTNLEIDSGPSVSSQYQWMNGVASRKKTFTWLVHALAPGTATAGPVVIRHDGGTTTLPAVSVEAVPDVAITTTDPSELLTAYAAAGREQVGLVAELSNPQPIVGQQTIVTWYLYTAESLRDVRVASPPQLAGFWTEELPVLNEDGELVTLAGGVAARKIPIRRVALFPLASGSVTVPPLEVAIEILQRIDDLSGRFGMFEARVAEIRRKSQPVSLTVRPSPSGEGLAVGRFSIGCSPPKLPQQGPVSFEVAVMGDGNLRAAIPPQLASRVDAEVSIQDVRTEVERSPAGARLRRTWRFLIYPHRSGSLTVPPVLFRFVDPSKNAVGESRCGGVTVNVRQASLPSTGAEQARRSTGSADRGDLIAIVAGVGLLALTVFLFTGVIRSRKRRQVARSLVAESARETRHRLDEHLASLGVDPLQLRPGSAAAEEFRAVMVLLELHERERSLDDDVTEELQRRIDRLLRVVRSSARQ
jgi:hypothetical protein